MASRCLHICLNGQFAVPFILATAALSGCVSPPPPEFAIYQQSFTEAREATGTVLAVYSPYERLTRAPQDDTKFDPNDARFIVDDAPAGNAEVIDRGFAAIASYNGVLARYASGESIETIKPQIAVFAEQASLAANIALPGAGPAVKIGADVLTKVAGALLSAADRAAFRDVVRQNSEQVLAFVDELRAASTIMYSTGYVQIEKKYQDDIEAAMQAEQIDRARQLDAKGKAEQKEYRILLARWVLLLDELREAVSALITAVAEDRPATFTAVEL